MTEGEGDRPAPSDGGVRLRGRARGHANGQQLFFSGQLTVEGDIGLAMKLQKLTEVLESFLQPERPACVRFGRSRGVSASCGRASLLSIPRHGDSWRGTSTHSAGVRSWETRERTRPKARYVLEHGAARIALALGEHVIGRGADADIVVDNERVSRRHAKLTVTDAGVFVEDLGSVNGVRVDGAIVHGKLLVTPGTRLSISDEAFVLLLAEQNDAARATQRVPTRDADDDHPADVTTRRTQAFGLMIGVIDKAIALGKPDEAERLIGSLLADVLEEAQRGREVQPAVAAAAAQAALKLARATGKSQWIEYPLRLYSARGRLLPLEAVDDLFAVARRAPRLDLPLLRGYVELVDASARTQRTLRGSAPAESGEHAECRRPALT